MTGYLLDTNVLSELTREEPDPRVLSFLDARKGEVWLPTVAIYEAEYGLRLLPVGRRRNLLTVAYAAILEGYGHRVLPLDRLGAEWAARYRAYTHQVGRPIDLGDAFIAGTARAYGLTVVTRNVRDFEALDVDVLNPGGLSLTAPFANAIASGGAMLRAW